ncbi:MutS protein msh5 [Branchiostoma belcheri]|nr:MutS protein msh5 [Branchiostoma belcheri]
MTQVSPSCIITSSKQDEKMLQVLRHKGPSVLLSSDEEEAGVQVEVLPSIDFSLEVCKRRILALNLPSIPQHFTESERVIYLSSLVAFENVNMVRATGALLKYLDKNRVGVELEDADVRTPVLALKTFSFLWFQRPLQDLVVLQQRHDAVEFFASPSHMEVTSSLQDSLKHMKNVNASKAHILT